VNRKTFLLTIIPPSLFCKEKKWVIYEFKEYIENWFKNNKPIINNQETRHEFFTLCYDWLEESRKQKKISGHRVFCNEHNNTKEVIDRGEFLAQIKIGSITTSNIKEVNVVIHNNKLTVYII